MEAGGPFGEHLRRYREAAGLTQEELAERAGLSANAVGALERGERQHPYPATVRRLADALGLDEAARAAFVAAGHGGSTPAAPAAAVYPSPTGLPGYLTPLIGREDEVAVAHHLLARPEVRLLTLTGPGGVGKTRLAVRVAAEARADFSDGVHFVPLAPLRDPALVLPTIARTIGVSEDRAALPTALAAAIGERRVLLVLDNCEQVAAAAPAVADLLVGCRHLKVLATSRAALRVQGEQEYRVPPLELPGAASMDRDALLRVPVVDLFIARARSIAAGLTFTDTDVAAIAAICRRLDGLPLAIELAAARVAVLPPSALLEQLESALDTLTGGARDLPVRHQTMRGTIAWSHDLLTEGERRLFARLAVFAAGCTLEAARAVCETPDDPAVELLDGLSTLVNQSLVRRIDDPDGSPRFAMLEVVWEFALERLVASGEVDAVRRRHARFYLGMAERTGAMLRGPGQVAWLDRLEREMDNLRGALDWAYASGEVAFGLRLAVALDRFWQYHARVGEGRHWLARGLAAGTDVPPVVRARALGLAGWLARFQGDMAGGATALAEGLALFRELDDQSGIAAVRDALGDLAHFQGDQQRARALHEENFALRRAIGDRWGVAMTLNSLGWVALAQGDAGEATRLLGESLTLVRELGDRRGTAMALEGLARVALSRDDVTGAATALTESLMLFRELGSKIDISLCLDGLGAVAALRGEAERSARLFGAARSLRESIGVDLAAGTEQYRARHHARARAQLGDARWEAAWAAGRALPIERAIEEALD